MRFWATARTIRTDTSRAEAGKLAPPCTFQAFLEQKLLNSFLEMLSQKCLNLFAEEFRLFFKPDFAGL